MTFFIISYVNSLERFIRESVWACAKLIVDEEAHGTLNRIVELNKTLTDSIRKRHKKEDSALCKNLKKRCHTDLLHFSTRKHNLVFFFPAESYFNSRIASYFFYIYFFFQEKTLGDISFKLETKIMNFMSGFFLKKYNQANSI